ncbi:hypothetical protein ABZ942_04110 [Nocardia sp. NPDC046473]|uniref:hypothetical protein n=1 Tax=Nocardia sp. NPDC046473 TaxID=3155733 RepID=UPI0033ECBB9E
MTPTTPPRPADLEAVFPELAPLARTATRLHPRPGSPSPQDSSIGGPLLWPAREPWPHCREDAHHTAPITLMSLADARLRRRIDLARESREALARPSREGWGYTPEERALLEQIQPRDKPEGPVAMLPVAQLYLRDVPGLRPPEGADLLQVLWCPFEHDDGMPTTAVFWRTAAAVIDILLAPPEPAAMDGVVYVPEPCLVHPEEVIEYPSAMEFGKEMHERLERWAIAELGVEYQNLCIPPGCKVGGYVNWGMTDPYPTPCPTCGTPTEPLLTISGTEWAFDLHHWIPYEDQAANLAWGPAQDGPKRPTRICVSDDNAQIIRVCPASPEHPHTQIMQ